MKRRGFLLGGLAAAAGCRVGRQASASMYAFVANRGGPVVAAVDLAALAVIRHIRLDAAPAMVKSHPARPAVYALTPETGTVHEILTERLEVRRRVRVAATASAMEFSPQGDALWALSAAPPQLIRVPLDRFEPRARVALPHMPAHFDVSPDGRLAAVSFGTVGSFALVDLPRAAIIRAIRDEGGLGQVRFRKDIQVLLAANLDRRRISIFDVASGRLVVHLPVAVRPQNLCFKADGGQLFITGEGMDAVVTVYPFRTEVGGTTLAGRAPASLAASNSPDYLFVANPGDGTRTGDVTTLSIQTQRVIAVTSVGREPCAVVVTPDDQYALVLNRQSGDMAVLHIESIAARRRKLAPLLTMIPVGSEPVSAVVRTI